MARRRGAGAAGDLAVAVRHGDSLVGLTTPVATQQAPARPEVDSRCWHVAFALALPIDGGSHQARGATPPPAEADPVSRERARDISCG